MGSPIIIANCSGFFGDRLSAAREMVEGGHIDVLTGDWLAELTMLILAKQRKRDPATGFARTFVTQMEHVMGTCVERGIRIVANAGGLNPVGCAEAVEKVAATLGVHPRVALVQGDDLMPTLPALRAAGVGFEHFDTGLAMPDLELLQANAYLGGWGIAEALGQGADIVITGRTTDAALVVGPSAWHHSWTRTDWHRLAGAVVAGHVIECGTQVTGGNYSFFEEVPGLVHPGFPIVEVAEDGSFVVTKHERHGGLVSKGTVTAQLLYEIGGCRYANPDVVARFDTIELSDDGPNRIRVTSVRGEPAPANLKVCAMGHGGFRSTTTMMLTGLDIERKADVFLDALWAAFPEGRSSFDLVDIQLIRSDLGDPASNVEATAQLRLTVKDRDEHLVTKLLAARIAELTLANYPGFYGLPSNAQAVGVYWPTLVPARLVAHVVTFEGRRTEVPPSGGSEEAIVDFEGPHSVGWDDESAPTVRLPIGRVLGARSGDKGGNANLGLWARSEQAYAWMSATLTVERLKELLGEVRDLDIERHEFPNLLGLNFVIYGLLGDGVASSTRIDGQAKSLGEFLRAKVADVPVSLLEAAPAPVDRRPLSSYSIYQ